jgi:periplasmic protein TonB
MHSTSIIDHLDHNIDALLAGAVLTDDGADPLLDELTGLSHDLRALPSTDFQQRLLADLHASTTIAKSAQTTELTTQQRLHLMNREQVRTSPNNVILPTLFAEGVGLYRVRRSSYAISVAAHAAMLALLFTSGVWMSKHTQFVTSSQLATDISPYLPTFSTEQAHGGGGGGEHSKLEASQGALPKASMQQIVPPMIVRNEHARLEAEPTVVLTPEQRMPQLGPLGDPMAHLGTTLSNGTGIGSGMGSGNGTGIGSGRGPGVGPGFGGGYGGGVFHVGGGVSAPRAIYDPDPEYSEEARKARFQGAVALWVIVGPDGRPHDVQISRSLGMGLDEKAVEAIKKWRFEPAMKDGHPVAVQVNVEVTFHLY